MVQLNALKQFTYSLYMYHTLISYYYITYNYNCLKSIIIVGVSTYECCEFPFHSLCLVVKVKYSIVFLLLWCHKLWIYYFYIVVGFRYMAKKVKDNGLILLDITITLTSDYYYSDKLTLPCNLHFFRYFAVF